MKRILTLLLVGVSLITSAQERCGTEAYTKNLMKNNSSYAIALDKVNLQMNGYPTFEEEYTLRQGISKEKRQEMNHEMKDRFGFVR